MHYLWTAEKKKNRDSHNKAMALGMRRYGICEAHNVIYYFCIVAFKLYRLLLHTSLSGRRLLQKHIINRSKSPAKTTGKISAKYRNADSRENLF